MVSSLVSIYFDSPLLSIYNKNTLYKTWDNSSRDVVNFDFLEKSQQIVSSVYDFPRKMFLMLHSINGPNFLTELGFDVIDFFNQAVFHMTTMSRQNYK